VALHDRFDQRISDWDLARLAATGRDDLALAEAGLADWVAALESEDRY